VKKTGRLVIADGGWKTCGWAAEIAALASEGAWKSLKAPIRRITLPDCPAPASNVLEKVYYRSSADIVKAVRQVLK
jgi:pyruvate dehydrogenase E1 component beta subunit